MYDFFEYTKGKIQEVLIEVDNDHEDRVRFSKRLPLVCYMTVTNEGLDMSIGQPLRGKKGDITERILFGEISHAEAAIVKRARPRTLGMLAAVLKFDLVLYLKNGSRLHFECPDLPVIPYVLAVLEKEHIPCKDPYGLKAVFNNSGSAKEACEYLEKNLDHLADEQGMCAWRLKWND
ncbi:hypothetical protein [Bacillus sp. 1P06AnD]|uniref:hypothetical protein n=1 Tax=Bacillus sp. 1P06AnD TaxID=3132208 RepID=UPI0039A2C89C